MYKLFFWLFTATILLYWFFLPFRAYLSTKLSFLRVDLFRGESIFQVITWLRNDLAEQRTVVILLISLSIVVATLILSALLAALWPVTLLSILILHLKYRNHEWTL
jgi:hypothetical protein